MEYLAPEQYLDNGELKVRSSADIWSLGIILYEMLFWHLPFSNPSNAPMTREAIYRFYNSE
jgi:serine/threonine protein kinase